MHLQPRLSLMIGLPALLIPKSAHVIRASVPLAVVGNKGVLDVTESSAVAAAPYNRTLADDLSFKDPPEVVPLDLNVSEERKDGRDGQPHQDPQHMIRALIL